MQFLQIDAVAILVLAGLIIFLLSSAIKILREYERGVVFTLGRYTRTYRRRT